METLIPRLNGSKTGKPLKRKAFVGIKVGNLFRRGLGTGTPKECPNPFAKGPLERPGAYTPRVPSLNFCEDNWVAKGNSIVDVAQLEHSIRDDLNPKVPRVMSVLEPLKVIIENYNGSEEIIAPYYPHDVPKEGSRKLPFSQEIYINRDDFSENPPKGYYRLTPNQPVRLEICLYY